MKVEKEFHQQQWKIAWNTKDKFNRKLFGVSQENAKILLSGIKTGTENIGTHTTFVDEKD